MQKAPSRHSEQGTGKYTNKLCTAGPVFAEGEEAASPFIDSAPSAAAVTGGQVRFIENEPKNEVKNIGFNFMDTKTRAYGCAGG